VLEDGQRHLALRDPSGMTDAVARLPPAVVAIVQLFDGETTRDEICAEYQRRYNAPLPRNVLDRIIDQLDQALLLDTERFRLHSASVFAEFNKSPVRAAHLAGKSYPKEREALAQQIAGFYAHAHGPGAPGERTRPLPRAIVAPHIDFQRGGPAYAWAYKPLAEAQERPELIVVFGTDHGGLEEPFTLTRKHYDTPFGHVETDTALVDAIAGEVQQRLGRPARERLFRDEHHHRGEHAIEFQMIWLRHILADHAFTVLPILCGSLHMLIEDKRGPDTDAQVNAVLESLRARTAGRKVLWVAGADLAHVGPRFGDPEPLSAEDRTSLERRDQATLEHCLRGDGPAWFGEIAREEDRRRVCGLTPIYALLDTARPGAGRLAAYAQCPADEQGGSIVSIASLVWD
jgi:hypothetical protein